VVASHGSLSGAVTALLERLDQGADAALLVVGEAWAEETQAQAPRRTGRLQLSVRFVPTGHLTGELRMVYYGEFVRTGSSPRTIARTTTRVVRASSSSSSSSSRRQGARGRPQATAQASASASDMTRGRAANDFAARAWASPRVREMRTHFAAYAFAADL